MAAEIQNTHGYEVGYFQHDYRTTHNCLYVKHPKSYMIQFSQIPSIIPDESILHIALILLADGTLHFTYDSNWYVPGREIPLTSPNCIEQVLALLSREALLYQREIQRRLQDPHRDRERLVPHYKPTL